MFAPANTAHFVLSIPSVRHDFKVLAFDGTESISKLYAIKVELVTERPVFDLQNLLSQPAFLQFGLNGEGIHGRIEDMCVGKSGKHLTHYHLTLVPALYYLQFRHNQRIFQHLSVPQIIAEVLQEHGILSDAHVAFQFGHTVYPEREYCVQYDETDLHFIQRLCEEEGIHYHFQHSEQGHVLVFGDDQTAFRKLAPTAYQQGGGMVADRPVIKHFDLKLTTRTTHVSRRTYDFQKAHVLLKGEAKSAFTPVLEDYDYPGAVGDEKRRKLLALRSLERHRSDYQLAKGQSDEPALRSGHILEITEHPRPQWNDLWLLLSVHHEGKQPQVLEAFASDEASTNALDGFNQGYRNTFTAIPWDVAYRPPLEHPKPRVLGDQTARVTGPAGEEIYCDQYGRVKVQFHWDRSDQNNDKSSCWLRVASSWAGQNYGAVSIPRVGMEVLVSFLEGDPDQPLINGCLHHIENPVPYELPANKTRSVFRSQSSPGGSGFNELHLEDRQGAEKIFVQAQRDLEQLVKHDCQLDVGNELRTTVGGERKTQLGSHDYLRVAGNSHREIGQTLVYQVGNEVHIRGGTHIVVDAGESLTLSAGGEHILLNSDGIFSSSELELSDIQLPPMAALWMPTPERLPLVDVLEEEEEEEELEEETPVGITLRIGMFFDGTGNNKNNSETVAACYAPDVNLKEAAEDIRAHCAAYGYDGNGSSPDSSYGNDVSNVVRLYELYTDLAGEILPTDASEASIAVYIEGIGTTSGKDDNVLVGQALGLGETGVAARVEQSPALIMIQIRELQRSNPELIIGRIEFDIFGFSRGAAAARHFANQLLKGTQSPVVEALVAGTTGLSESFAWQPQTDLSINFIGLFDTVAAIANPALFDFTGANAYNPGIDLRLTDGCAKKVVQLVARDEIRQNFALNSAGSADIVLPGVHSDLGGGYLPRATEKLLLSKPLTSMGTRAIQSSSTTAYVFTASQLTTWANKDLLDEDAAEASIKVASWEKELAYNPKNDSLKEGPQKRVYAAVSMQRPVRGELSLVYLRIMRELAVKHGVPFLPIRENIQALALPAELKPIAEKLQAFALGDSQNTALTSTEEALLRQRYIHQSAHWNAAKNRNSSDLEIVFINRPTDNNKRVVHPNE